ncbi:hypothetical protein ACGFYU_15235 [Streptomyces sp. NPDC048337]|uniref:hypothetical protein n=1 Tax=Streptomyces sp. NPDC048337 TaxID=3365535 RepID=UPI00371B2685
MSRRRRTWCLLAAVLAILLGTRAPALAGPVDAGPGPRPASASARAADPAPAPQKGPACDPTGPDRGGVPGVPVRVGGDHGQLPAGAGVPEGPRAQRAMPVRALVRGPDRAAPGPVELAVMRV